MEPFHSQQGTGVDLGKHFFLPPGSFYPWFSLPLKGVFNMLDFLYCGGFSLKVKEQEHNVKA
jgi:hypothetical protein